MENKKINVGLVGMGLNTYWSQFEGLYERLCKYQKTRSHTDGFQRNNAKCLDEKGISRFVPHSSI